MSKAKVSLGEGLMILEREKIDLDINNGEFCGKKRRVQLKLPNLKKNIDYFKR